MPTLKRKASVETPVIREGKKSKRIADRVANAEATPAVEGPVSESPAGGKENKKSKIGTSLKKLARKAGKLFSRKPSAKKDAAKEDAQEAPSNAQPQVETAAIASQDAVVEAPVQNPLPEPDSKPTLTKAELQAAARAERAANLAALRSAAEGRKRMVAEEAAKRKAEEAARKEAEEFEAVLEAAAETAREAGAPWAREPLERCLSPVASGKAAEEAADALLDVVGVVDDACTAGSVSGSSEEPKIYEPSEWVTERDILGDECVPKLVPAVNEGDESDSDDEEAGPSTGFD